MLCVALLPTGASGSTSVYVTCSQLNGTWPSNNFTVWLMASNGAPGCIGSNSAPATVTTTVKPTIVVRPISANSVCNDTNTTVVTFTLSGLDAGGVYTISSVTPTGNVTCWADNVTAGVLVQLGAACSHHQVGWQALRATLAGCWVCDSAFCLTFQRQLAAWH